MSPCLSCSVVWVSRIQSTPGSLGRAPTVAPSPQTAFLWILWGHSEEQRGHVVRFICRCCFLFGLVLQALSRSRPPSAGIVSRRESQDCARLCALHAMYSRKCVKHQCQLQLFSLTCQQWHSAVFSSNLEHVSKDAVCVRAQPRVRDCVHFEWYYEILFTWRGGNPSVFQDRLTAPSSTPRRPGSSKAPSKPSLATRFSNTWAPEVKNGKKLVHSLISFPESFHCARCCTCKCNHQYWGFCADWKK